MGIDLKAGGRRVGHKSSTKVVKTQNPYNRLLINLYQFLSRRTDSKFNETILKRLHQSKVNTPPIGLYKLNKFMLTKKDKIAVIVGKVTDDVRMMEDPTGLKVCALAFTAGAKARIEKGGGECMTFDQLALVAPTGENTVLLRGRKVTRASVAHFGHRTTVDNPHTHDGVKPFVRSKGRKFEKARGRRKSRGFKV